MKKHLLVLAFLVHVVWSVAAEAEPLPLMLATDYDGPPDDLQAYWVSEKLDGVRARWDGRKLVSRQGNVFRAPLWFTRDFPAVPLDGELWLGRGRFEEVSGIVRRLEPSPEAWRDIRFMVFDLPVHGETFGERLARLRALLVPSPTPYIGLIEQWRVSSAAALRARLDEVVAGGGEGLMLHHQDGRYVAGRTRALQKLKPYRDADACVVAHIAGEGRLEGVLGSLLVETPDGRRFRIGTGFTDDQRAAPPGIGSLVTFRYRGRTSTGLPRFASFLRVRIPSEVSRCAGRTTPPD